MGIFDKIKHAIWGDDETDVATTTPEETYLGTTSATTGVVPDVATPVDNPVVRDIAAAGVQPVSKPAAIEQAQNPSIAANPGTTATAVDVAAQLDRAVTTR
jgi:hypothetical protein